MNIYDSYRNGLPKPFINDLLHLNVVMAAYKRDVVSICDMMCAYPLLTYNLMLYLSARLFPVEIATIRQTYTPSPII